MACTEGRINQNLVYKLRFTGLNYNQAFHERCIDIKRWLSFLQDYNM